MIVGEKITWGHSNHRIGTVLAICPVANGVQLLVKRHDNQIHTLWVSDGQDDPIYLVEKPALTKLAEAAE